jgi:hypothetical protein
MQIDHKSSFMETKLEHMASWKRVRGSPCQSSWKQMDNDRPKRWRRALESRDGVEAKWTPEAHHIKIRRGARDFSQVGYF